MKKEGLYIGCSGFYNNDWKGFFYPEGAKGKDFLTLYSQKFNAVEINSTFYRNPTSKTLAKWTEETPDHFRFFIKIPRAISHMKRLENCKEEISRFCDHISSNIQEKLSGFLYQFPASFRNTPENIERILANLDFNFLNVVEFRHESWWTEDIFNILKDNEIVFSGVSFPGNLPETVIESHPEVLYYRLHGKPVLYKSEYAEKLLDHLSARIQQAGKKKSFIFFNNTWGNAAIKNALYLKNILHQKN